jgi:hypothetical protein
MRIAVIALLAACSSSSSDEPNSGNGAWPPTPGTSWQIQLRGTVDTSIDVDVYDIDLFDTPQTTLDTLHAAGRKVVCYFSAGSFENWRTDAAQFPQAAIGSPLDDWPGEFWIDTRNAAVRSVLTARMDLAKQRGCDGVDPDNVDGFANATGFALTRETQLDFDRFLAREAHARGLYVGLKNDLDQIGGLVVDFDWQINEQCFQFAECDTLSPFVVADKPVWNIEYGAQSLADRVCPDANARNFDTLVMRLELDGSHIACR